MSKTKIGSNAQYTSAGLGLTTIGKHCYAYSGEFTADTTSTTVLNFTTGKGYIVGTVRLSGMVDLGSPATGASVACRLKFNNISVIALHTEGSEKDMAFSDVADIVIPPLTNVTAIVDSNTTSANVDGTVSIIGEVYG